MSGKYIKGVKITKRRSLGAPATKIVTQPSVECGMCLRGLCGRCVLVFDGVSKCLCAERGHRS